MREKVEMLAKKWHEVGRKSFETHCKNLDYDTYAPKTVKEKKKYFYMDEGTSGAYLVDKVSGNVYHIKSCYGVPNPKKCLGHFESVTGEMLFMER